MTLFHRKRLLGCATIALLAGTPGLPVLTAVTAPPAQARPIVSPHPAAGTPDVNDGRVSSVVRVRGLMVLGGTFQSVSEPGSDQQLTRHRVLAFDRATGRVSDSFKPEVDGAVEVVVRAPGGRSVFIGGSFTSVDGVPRDGLARLRLRDGAVMKSFDAGTIDGPVHDLRVLGPRLLVAGNFREIAGKQQAALATLRVRSGRFDPFVRIAFTGFHNGGRTNVLKVDVTSDRRRMVAIGNFRYADGARRQQLAVLDLRAQRAVVAPFRTRFYEPRCSPRYNTFVRDVSISPDDRWFVVVTAGGKWRTHGPCDSAARFETASRGGNVRYSWLNNTGGDSSYAVEATRSAVYVGGHARWQNNPYGNNTVGPGAVPRPGIAALDPDSGLPFRWNPTRARGVGVFDFLSDRSGLWVASDTDEIGGATRGRIALLPAGSDRVPALEAPRRLDDVFVVPADSSRLTVRPWRRGEFRGQRRVASGDVDWATVRGAFMLDGQLYVADVAGNLTRRGFDGRSYGSVVRVDASDGLARLTEVHDDLSRATSLFYDRGRLYYTVTGDEELHYRYFNAESDIVGARRGTVAGKARGLRWSRVRGAFVAGRHLYWSTPKGELWRARWETGTAFGKVVGKPERFAKRGQRARGWAGRALFTLDRR